MESHQIHDVYEKRTDPEGNLDHTDHHNHDMQAVGLSHDGELQLENHNHNNTDNIKLTDEEI